MKILRFKLKGGVIGGLVVIAAVTTCAIVLSNNDDDSSNGGNNSTIVNPVADNPITFEEFLSGEFRLVRFIKKCQN